eukprot:5539492-Amphidinium_carterae.1
MLVELLWLSTNILLEGDISLPCEKRSLVGSLPFAQGLSRVAASGCWDMRTFEPLHDCKVQAWLHHFYFQVAMNSAICSYIETTYSHTAQETQRHDPHKGKDRQPEADRHADREADGPTDRLTEADMMTLGPLQ